MLCAGQGIQGGIYLENINSEPINEVLKLYPIKVLSIKINSYKGKKGVWMIETSSGLKVLKKISNSEATLKFILSAINHLKNNGVNIPRINKAIDGAEYVKYNGICFILSDAVKGSPPDYNNPKELIAIVEGLANFHKGSIGFKVIEDTKPKNHLGTWIEEYDYQIEDMNKFYKEELAKTQNNEIGKIVKSDFPYFYERGKKAIEGLKTSEYSAWVKKIEASGGLCHQDFASGNLIMTASEFYILDTDSLTLEIPARDIRKLLNKILKKYGHWDINLVTKILSYYQNKNPLTKEQWQVVKYDLMFPHLFLSAMNKYYYQRDKEWSIESYTKKIKDMNSFEKTIDPLLNNFNTIIDKVIGT